MGDKHKTHGLGCNQKEKSGIKLKDLKPSQ